MKMEKANDEVSPEKMKGAGVLKPFMREGQKLNRILESLDTDLKGFAGALNQNFKILSKNFKELDAKLDKLIELAEKKE